MADFLTLGLHIDLSEVDQAAAKLSVLKQTFKDIGAEAAKSGQQATTAVKGQADAFRAAMNQMQADASRVLSFRMNLLRQELAEVQANTAAEAAAIAALGQQRMAAYAAWTAASKTANAQMLSDTLSRVTDANAEEYLAAVYAIEQQQRTLAAKQASEAAQAAATAARVADEIASEDLIAVYRTEAQVKRMRDAQEAAAYEAEVAAQSAAAQVAAVEAAEAARQTALAQDRASYEAWWALMAAQPAQAGATSIAGVEADIAAREASAAAMAQQTAAGQAYVAQLEEQVRTLGLSRSEMAAYRAEQLGVTAEAAAAIMALEAIEKSSGHAGAAVGGLGLRVKEIIVLFREWARGDMTRMASSATIFAGTFEVFGKVVSFMLSPMGLAAVAAGLLAKAMNDGAAETDRLNNLLQATGNYAGVASGQFYAMAQTIAAATDTGIGKAEKTLMDLVEAGKLTGFQLQAVGLAATELGVLTGQSADKIAKSLGEMIDKPTEGAAKLEAQYHLLTAAQYEHIAVLEREGDRQGAFNALMNDFNAALDQQAQHLGPLGGLIHGIAEFWDGAWNAAKRYGDYLINGLPMGQQVLQLQSQINDLQARGAPLHDPGLRAFGQDDLSTLIAKRDALIKKGQADNKAAEDSQVQTRGVAAVSALDASYKSLGGSAQLAAEEIAKLHAELADAQAAYNLSPTAEMKAHLDDLRGHMPAMEAAVRKKYDRSDAQAETAAQRAARQSNIEQRGMLNDEAKITSLGGQLGNLDPSAVADAMAKIQQAYDQAYASWSKANNAFEQANAARHAADAADIERLTLWGRLADANDKQTRSELDKVHALQLSRDATTAANAVMSAFYQSGTIDLTAYAAALKAQDAISLAAQNSQADYAIALQYGATSVDGIAAALIASLPPTVQVTDAIREQAQQVQRHAQQTLDATRAVNGLTLADKNLADAQKQTTASLANTAAVDQYVAALRSGIAAMVDYSRTQAIMRATAAAGGNLAVGAANVDRDAVANAAKVTAELNEQARLATLSTQDRAMEARQAQLLAGYIAESGQSYASLDTATKERLSTEAKITAEYEQQHEWLAKLTGQTKDAIEQAFVDSGKLDFSSLGDAVGKELRKQIYDSFLAKPIDMVVNVVMQGASKQLSALLGGGNGGSSLSLPDVDALLGSSGGGGGAGGMASMMTMMSHIAAPIAMAAAVSQLSSSGASSLTKIFGGSAAQQKEAAAVGQWTGIIPGLIAGLLTHPSNFTAGAYFDGGGNYRLGGDKPDAATTSAAASIGGAVQQTVAALKSLGIDSGSVISAIEVGARDASKISLRSGGVISTAQGDAQALADAVNKALLQYGTYKDGSEKSLVDQMISANDSFQQITAALGVAADALKQLQEAGIAGGLTQADATFIEKGGSAADVVGSRTVLSDLQTSALQYTDPQAYALAQLKQSQTKRRADIQNYADEGLLSPDQMAAINSTLSALESSETTNALSQFNSAIMTAAQRTQALATAQQQLITFLTGLTTSSLSPLSPTEQLKAAQNAYETDLTAAQGGDPKAMQALASDAQTYLQQAQGYYGSSQSYAGIYNSVKSNLSALTTAKFSMPAAGQTAAGGSTAPATATVDTGQIGQITSGLGDVATAVQDVSLVITAQMANQYAALQALQSGITYQQYLLNGGLVYY